MNRMKKLLGGTAVTLYFIYGMGLALLILIFMPIGFLMDVDTILTSGFATADMAVEFISITGLIIGISMVIPSLRKIYKVFPWMYSFIKIFYFNLIILCVGLSILNKGYEVTNTTRHTIALIIMIIQIIICRLYMCLYFKKKPVKSIS